MDLPLPQPDLTQPAAYAPWINALPDKPELPPDAIVDFVVNGDGHINEHFAITGRGERLLPQPMSEAKLVLRHSLGRDGLVPHVPCIEQVTRLPNGRRVLELVPVSDLDQPHPQPPLPTERPKPGREPSWARGWAAHIWDVELRNADPEQRETQFCDRMREILATVDPGDDNRDAANQRHWAFANRWLKRIKARNKSGAWPRRRRLRKSDA
jgi:hypothetical protein